jgi:hypothetical protein
MPGDGEAKPRRGEPPAQERLAWAIFKSAPAPLRRADAQSADATGGREIGAASSTAPAVLCYHCGRPSATSVKESDA